MSGSSNPKATWICHNTFIDLCLEQSLKGNKRGTHFNMEGWCFVVELFYKMVGVRYNKRKKSEESFG